MLRVRLFNRGGTYGSIVDQRFSIGHNLEAFWFSEAMLFLLTEGIMHEFRRSLLFNSYKVIYQFIKTLFTLLTSDSFIMLIH